MLKQYFVSFQTWFHVKIKHWNILKFQVVHSHVLHFHAPKDGPSLSDPAFSCHTIWSVICRSFIFISCIFNEYKLLSLACSATTTTIQPSHLHDLISVKQPLTPLAPRRLSACLDYQLHPRYNSQVAAFDMYLEPSHSQSFYFWLTSRSRSSSSVDSRSLTLSLLACFINPSGIWPMFQTALNYIVECEFCAEQVTFWRRRRLQVLYVDISGIDQFLCIGVILWYAVALWHGEMWKVGPSRAAVAEGSNSTINKTFGPVVLKLFHATQTPNHVLTRWKTPRPNKSHNLYSCIQ